MRLVQVCPPSCDTPVKSPWAPPVDHRFCCHTPITFCVFRGLTATIGSTSAFRYSVPAAGTASQPAANAEALLTRNCASPDGGVGGGGGGVGLLSDEPPPPPQPARIAANRKPTDARRMPVGAVDGRRMVLSLAVRRAYTN